MQATIVGNLVEDPNLEFTGSGTPYVRTRIAENRRYQDRSGEWQEETSFYTLKLWREVAEHAAESLSKGDRVMVTGRFEQRNWETDSGEKRSTYEVTVDEIGPSLRWATASVTRIPRDGNGYGNGRSNGRGNGNGNGRASAPARQPAPVPSAGPADDDPFAVDDGEPF